MFSPEFDDGLLLKKAAVLAASCSPLTGGNDVVSCLLFGPALLVAGGLVGGTAVVAGLLT
jgi:hypothetical protein